MDLQTFVLLYLLSVPVFFTVDMIWLGYLARDLYRREIGYLLGDVRWGAAVGFYLIYLIGVTYFATYPAYVEESVWHALWLGGLFGFFTYATYDMTNLATVKGWPVKIVVIDIIWGTVLGASVAGGTVFLAGLFF